MASVVGMEQNQSVTGKLYVVVYVFEIGKWIGVYSCFDLIGV